MTNRYVRASRLPDVIVKTGIVILFFLAACTLGDIIGRLVVWYWS